MKLYMKALLVLKNKITKSDGTVVERVIYKLPETTRERPHGYKYRLYCGKAGKCFVRYDNEIGKGDHKHIKGLEIPYKFTTLAKLLSDFQRDIKKHGG